MCDDSCRLRRLSVPMPISKMCRGAIRDGLRSSSAVPSAGILNRVAPKSELHELIPLDDRLSESRTAGDRASVAQKERRGRHLQARTEKRKADYDAEGRCVVP